MKQEYELHEAQKQARLTEDEQDIRVRDRSIEILQEELAGLTDGLAKFYYC